MERIFIVDKHLHDNITEYKVIVTLFSISSIVITLTISFCFFVVYILLVCGTVSDMYLSAMESVESGCQKVWVTVEIWKDNPPFTSGKYLRLPSL